ncbi:YihY/virulence factor BrkB family protein [Pelomonas sp. KK5]|uniref:YihY/virulence factor BrkB family protein n=1 Tax=Pelomonas sp. KK5 TaxID=1855730 RepID=UPI00097BB393|nr:YihY/virulence factor BrkB family protein [Pelomonas sp. KK5]
MRLKDLYHLARQAVEAWIDDHAASRGAALAYYTLFSMAPLLLIVTSVAGLMFDARSAREEIVDQLRGVIGESGAAAVKQLLDSAAWPPHGGVLASVIGLVLLLVGATSVFAELQATLDLIWRSPHPVPPSPRQKAWWLLLRTRLMSFGLILGVGFLLIVSLVFSAAFAALEKTWAPWFGEWQLWATLANVTLSFSSMTVLFAMIYKLMPTTKVAWRDVWLGALVTSMLFSVGPSLTGLYIGHSAVAQQFGAAGSMVVLLIWIYYSAQIFLLGAEFTWVYASTRGSRRPGLSL